MVCKNTGEEIGLQLEADGSAIRISLGPPRRTLRGAHQMLDMVYDLMGDHVRNGKVAGCAKPPAELFDEREVEVDALVSRAVERSDRCVREATLRLHRLGEEDES